VRRKLAAAVKEVAEKGNSVRASAAQGAKGAAHVAVAIVYFGSQAHTRVSVRVCVGQLRIAHHRQPDHGRLGRRALCRARPHQSVRERPRQPQRSA
jgi:hypothetical protein